MATSVAARSSLEEMEKSGKFIRVDSAFREMISATHPIYKPEANRYHLYISYACPWANGCLAALKMKGLEDIISVSVTHPTWNRTRPDDTNDVHAGWVFRDPSDENVTPASGYGSIPCTGCIPDNVNNAKSVRDLYVLSKDTGGKYSVPVLWDKHTKTIVNNESQDILRMFDSAFDHLLEEGSSVGSLTLFPPHLEAAMSSTNEWIYHKINNGVYRAGFAKSQSAYDEAVTDVFEALDQVESILADRRYILSSEHLTALDIRLFMTLVRFDEVYVVYFKCNKRTVASYHNIRNYMRELFQHPVIGSVVHMDHIKHHYYTSHPTLNTYAVVPAGPGVVADLSLPHDRDRSYAK